MTSFTRFLTSILLASALAAGCAHPGNDSPVVAIAYNHELHLDDLKGLVGEGVSAEDSIAIVSSYVEQWIRKNVILTKAEKNITDNFDKQLNEYKTSLLIYAYEQQILNQLLDTIVSDQQIAEYYEQHKDDFRLKSAIVKATYVSAPAKSPALTKLKSIINSYSFGDRELIELENTASRHNLSGYYDIDTWIPFYTLQGMVPITTYNEKLYLKQNHSIVLTDDGTTYLVRIVDYKVSEENSPLELQKDNIHSIILNHRKIEILNRLQSDLLEEAEKGDNVKRYI